MSTSTVWLLTFTILNPANGQTYSYAPESYYSVDDCQSRKQELRGELGRYTRVDCKPELIRDGGPRDPKNRGYPGYDYDELDREEF